MVLFWQQDSWATVLDNAIMQKSFYILKNARFRPSHFKALYSIQNKANKQWYFKHLFGQTNLQNVTWHSKMTSDKITLVSCPQLNMKKILF